LTKVTGAINNRPPDDLARGRQNRFEKQVDILACRQITDIAAEKLFSGSLTGRGQAFDLRQLLIVVRGKELNAKTEICGAGFTCILRPDSDMR